MKFLTAFNKNDQTSTEFAERIHAEAQHLRYSTAIIVPTNE